MTFTWHALRHAGRHGGSLKRLRVLLVALSIPQGPSRAAWAALSANGKHEAAAARRWERRSGKAPTCDVQVEFPGLMLTFHEMPYGFMAIRTYMLSSH